MCGIWILATAGVVYVYMFKRFLRIQALLGRTDILSASLNHSGFHIEKYVNFFSSVKGRLLERPLEMLTWTKTVGS